MNHHLRGGSLRALAIFPGLAAVALAMAWSATRPIRGAILAERSSFDLGTTPAGEFRRHSWEIRNEANAPIRLRTRFTSGRCGFSLWLGEDYVVAANGRLIVSLTIPTPHGADIPFAGLADVLTDDPDQPRLRFRMFGITGREPAP